MKLRSVQILRAIAAIAVVTVHARMGEHGAAGVDLFFVISGFIIGRVMTGRSAWEFARDRFWRIYPIYWVALAPWIFINSLYFALEPVRIFSSFTLWPVFGDFYTSYLTVGWSLCFELLFYAGATMAIVTGRGRLIVLCTLGLIGAGLFVTDPLLNFIGNPMILEFLFGLGIARIRPRWELGMPLAVTALFVWAASPAAELSMPPVGPSQLTILSRVLWWGLPAAAIVYAGLSLERFTRHKSLDLAVSIGDASYSIYLIHVLAIIMAGGVLGIPGVLIAAVAGMAMHRYVEKPLLKLAPWMKAHNEPLIDGRETLNRPAPLAPIL